MVQQSRQVLREAQPSRERVCGVSHSTLPSHLVRKSGCREGHGPRVGGFAVLRPTCFERAWVPKRPAATDAACPPGSEGGWVAMKRPRLTVEAAAAAGGIASAASACEAGLQLAFLLACRAALVVSPGYRVARAKIDCRVILRLLWLLGPEEHAEALGIGRVRWRVAEPVAGRLGYGGLYRQRQAIKLPASDRRLSLSIAGTRDPCHGSPARWMRKASRWSCSAA